mmetsp:Transcript_28868/g.64085  ORF Transcript_28868/g.64085 Transcript_28868/m.64085 type:complete len:258 (+) Transcript_28868:639-1412(+)
MRAPERGAAGPGHALLCRLLPLRRVHAAAHRGEEGIRRLRAHDYPAGGERERAAPAAGPLCAALRCHGRLLQKHEPPAQRRGQQDLHQLRHEQEPHSAALRGGDWVSCVSAAAGQRSAGQRHPQPRGAAAGAGGAGSAGLVRQHGPAPGLHRRLRGVREDTDRGGVQRYRAQPAGEIRRGPGQRNETTEQQLGRGLSGADGGWAGSDGLRDGRRRRGGYHAADRRRACGPHPRGQPRPAGECHRKSGEAGNQELEQG